jgi:hypothetical protein
MKAKYIYIFYDILDKCLYVGQTTDTVKRFNSHKRQTWWNEVYAIEYAKVEKEILTDLYEIYYINKLKGLYNRKDIKVKYIKFKFSELKFMKFLTKDMI